MHRNKIMTLQEAIGLIKDGDTVSISSAGMIGYPEYISRGLVESFEKNGTPKDLTISAGCGHAIPVNNELGDAKFGKPGLLKKYIGSHPMTAAPVMNQIVNEEIEGYCLPQGILNQLYRTSAAKQPGLLSKIGIGTYIDPRQEGGKLNKKSTDDIVKLMEIDGEEWLYYKAYPINVAIIRATTADENGNLTLEHEALKLEVLETAMAAKAQKGIVIAQVKQVVKEGTLKARDVVVPGELVDAIVIAEEPEKYHKQTQVTFYSPFMSGELSKPELATKAGSSAELSPADVICRRALQELYPGCLVNIGLGIGAGIGAFAEEEGFLDKMTFTLELGTFGGVPTPLSDFGCSISPSSFVAHPSMFDYYHTGSLDVAFLGTAEVDKHGNVNVSKMSGRNAGQGGFIDISSTSKKTVFVTFFTAKGMKASVSDGKLVIDQEGALPKFVDEVAQITYNGEVAVKDGRKAVYITERAVFELTKDGLMLTEIAPGVDLEKDVLGQMKFTPIISDQLKTMDERIFIPGRMGLFD